MTRRASHWVSRLVARVRQKARQLERYCAAVMLALTVPPQWQTRQELDLKNLAGSLTVTLGVTRQVSALLLSLWDVDPAPARSGVRLANVFTVERPPGQRAYPRVRMLVLNPYAEQRIGENAVTALRELL